MPVPATAATLDADAQRRAFATVFLLEMWERFGFYGMAALLVLFMVEHVGFADARANLTWGAFTALVYATPSVGGWIGDNVLGTRRTMVCGAVLLAAGYALLTLHSETLRQIFFALALIAVGNGLFKPNAANLVRHIYRGDDGRLDAAFTLYYMAINLGSMASMLAAPWVSVRWGWQAAFGLCCAGLLVGIANYAWRRQTLNVISTGRDAAVLSLWRLAAVIVVAVLVATLVTPVLANATLASTGIGLASVVTALLVARLWRRADPGEQTGITIATILMLQTVLFFIFYQQMSTSLTLFALRNVTAEVTLFGQPLWHLEPAQFQALNPIWIMLLSPLLARLYRRLDARGRDPGVATKFVIGFAVVAAGFFLFGASGSDAHAGRVSPWWMIGGYGLYSLGELLVSGLGLAMIARYVPERLSGFMMGVYFLTTAMAGYLGSLIANLAQMPAGSHDPVLSLPVYTGLFSTLGWIALGGTLVAAASLRWLRRLDLAHPRR